MKIMKAAGLSAVVRRFRERQSGNLKRNEERNQNRADGCVHGECQEGGYSHPWLLYGGVSGGNKRTAEQTIELALRLNPDTVQFYPVMVYPGTEAYQDYLEKGWLAAPDFRAWLTPAGLHNCVIRNDVFSPVDLVKMVR